MRRVDLNATRHASNLPTGLTTLLTAACLVAIAACSEQPLDEGDRDLVVTMGQLEPYGVELPDDLASYENFKRERWIDGSVAIEYEFEAAGFPYLYSVSERHKSKLDACNSYSANAFGLKLGAGELEDRNDIFEYGDKSRFGMLMSEGEPYGNFFVMCKDRTSMMVVLGGLYFDDGEMWQELVGPNLDALRSFAED